MSRITSLIKRYTNKSGLTSDSEAKKPLPTEIQQEEILDPLIFRNLPSDNIIQILDFWGGEISQDLSTFSLLIAHCFGKFRVDSSVKFLFRYAKFNSDKIDLSGLIFICNAQLGQCNESTVEDRILHTLCKYQKCSLEKDEILEGIIDILEKFSKENKQLCLHFKRLNFYEVETLWEVIEKCFEIFPNFEKLKIGYRFKLPTKSYRPPSRQEYRVNKETVVNALEKSNKKCKKFTCHNRNYLQGDLPLQLPNLEKCKLIVTDYVKNIDHLDKWKNLKTLDLEYFDDRTYSDKGNVNNPLMFQALSKCEQLSRLSLKNVSLFGEEFVHLNNCLPNLTYLNLIGSDGHGIDGIVNAIATFHNLRTLIVDCNEKGMIAKLANLKHLEYLETCISASLSLEDVRAVSQFVNLKTLIVGPLLVTDKEGKILANLKNLEQFSFTSGGDNYFSIKLIRFLFENLNVKRYKITYNGKDLNKLPQKIQDRMHDYHIRVR